MKGYHSNFSFINNQELYKEDKKQDNITNYYVFRKAFSNEESFFPYNFLMH